MLLSSLRSLRNAFVGSVSQHAGGMFGTNTLQKGNEALVLRFPFWNKHQGAYMISLINSRCYSKCYSNRVLIPVQSGKSLKYLSKL